MSTVVKMKFGSHLYGLETPESDTDYKSIILPTREEILLGDADFARAESTGDDNSKNTSEDTDTEVYSLQRFIELAVAGDTAAVDMLHAPDHVIIESSDIWRALVDSRKGFYSKSVSKHLDYVKNQANKYGIKGSRLAAVTEILAIIEPIKDVNVWHNTMTGRDDSSLTRVDDIMLGLPDNEFCGPVTTEDGRFYEVLGRKFQNTQKLSAFRASMVALDAKYGERARKAEANEGVDWKAVSHALRAGYQIKNIFQTGSSSYPLTETWYLAEVKAGKLDFTTNVQLELESLVRKVKQLAAMSYYQEEVDSELWDSVVCTYHEAIIRGGD